MTPLFPSGGFKGCLPEPSYLLSRLLLGSGTGSRWLGEAWRCCVTPELQQLWITCAGKSMASCSISASPLRDVCERFWPAAQPLCPHPTEYLTAQKEEGELKSVSQWHLSSPSQTHASSFPCFISFMLSATPTRRRGLWLLPRQTAHPSTQLGSGCWICSRLFPSVQQHWAQLPQTGAQKCADRCTRALSW